MHRNKPLDGAGQHVSIQRQQMGGDALHVYLKEGAVQVKSSGHVVDFTLRRRTSARVSGCQLGDG